MPFKPGQKKPPGSGMKKGQVTKDRQMLLDKAKELGVDPFEILLLFAADRWDALGYDEPTYTVYTAGGGSYEARTIPVETRAKCAADACQYMLPKLKSVDVALTDLKDKGKISVTLDLGGSDARQPAPAGAHKTAKKAP